MQKLQLVGRAGLLCLAWLLLAVPSLAHGDGKLGVDDLWTAWVITPDIALSTVFVLWVYARGMLRRRTVKVSVRPWRHVAFFAGALLIFMALQSPIDPFAERAFWVHQIQHMLLRVVGPMLIALSWPSGVLIAGLPRWMRSRMLRPVAQNQGIHWLMHLLRIPAVVFAIFVASLLIWEIPSVHDAALRNDALHYTMHATMLLSGMLFFWRVFERRPYPHAISYGVRLLMLMGATMFAIVLGSATTLKTVVLYSAYDDIGRLLSSSPMSDEATGGIIIWIPQAMMGAVGILIGLYAWNAAEVQALRARFSRPGSNSAALEFPETAEELWLKVEKPNRRTAQALSAIPISIFVLVVFMALGIHAQQ